jgi:hypothetical protein
MSGRAAFLRAALLQGHQVVDQVIGADPAARINAVVEKYAKAFPYRWTEESAGETILARPSASGLHPGCGETLQPT